MAQGWGGRRPGAGAKGKHRHSQLPRTRQICVYILTEEGSQAICKVGITDYLIRRIATLQTGNSRQLTAFAAYEIEDIQTASFIENKLLLFYGKSLIRGEWLAVSPESVKDALETGLRSVGLEVVNLIDNDGPLSKLKIIKFGESS